MDEARPYRLRGRDFDGTEAREHGEWTLLSRSELIGVGDGWFGRMHQGFAEAWEPRPKVSESGIGSDQAQPEQGRFGESERALCLL